MKSRHRRPGPVLPIVAGIITLCSCLAATPVLAGDFTILNGAQFASDVSNNGVVVGIDNYWNAWSWSIATGNVTLPPSTAGYYGRANGVSADGSVVTGTSFAVGSFGLQIANQAWRWTASTGTVSLGNLPTGQNEDWGTAISSNGTVIVGSAAFCNGSSCGGPTAYNWTSTSGMQPLVGGGLASAVSGDGLVAVGMSDPGPNPSLVRWTGQLDGFNNPTFSNLTSDNLGNFYSSGRTMPFGVSADGSVIVGSGWEYSGGTGNPQAWRWTQGEGFVGLGFLNYWNSSATGISDDGSVIVGDSGGNAFVWTEANGMRSLKDILIAEGVTGIDSWDSLAAINAISPDGKWVVGTFQDCTPSSGSLACGNVPFLANIASTTVVPVPGAVWLFGSGLAGLFGFARKKISA